MVQEVKVVIFSPILLLVLRVIHPQLTFSLLLHLQQLMLCLQLLVLPLTLVATGAPSHSPMATSAPSHSSMADGAPSHSLVATGALSHSGMAAGAPSHLRVVAISLSCDC